MIYSVKKVQQWAAPLVRVLRTNRHFVLGLIFVSILGDIFYIPVSSDIRFFGFVGAYILGARWYKLKSSFTFSLCLALLAIMYVLFLTTNTSIKTERAAVWLVLFWIVGIIQQWKEIGKRS